MIGCSYLFEGFIHCILTKLFALLIAFSLHKLVKSIEIAFLLKIGN